MDILIQDEQEAPTRKKADISHQALESFFIDIVPAQSFGVVQEVR